MDRKTRKEQRMRGSERREVDLNDLVFDLPPPESFTQENAELRHEIEHEQEVGEENSDINELEEKEEDKSISKLPPITTISNSEQRIIQQHQQIVNERLKQREKERKELSKVAKQYKQSKRSKSIIKSKSIKITYRRIPSNKMKLIYLDVISQMIKDYIKEKSVLNSYIETVNELEKVRKRSKGERKEPINDIRKNSKDVLIEYYNRIDDYFSSLIDIKLSNSLIKNDLDKINLEKNKLRFEIFQIRKERNSVGLEMNEIRNRFKDMQKKYKNDEKIYKDLINLKEGDDYVEDGGNVIDKLNHITNGVNSKRDVLKMIQSVNEHLKRMADK